MTESRQALLTVAGRSFEGLDLDAFAQALGLDEGTVNSLTTVADVVAAGSALRGLIRGTGDTHFDAQSAAALGIPLVIVGPDPALGLAVRHAQELQATVVAGETLEGLADKVRAIGKLEPVMSASVFEHSLLEQAKAKGAHIVLPEGEDDRILLAAGQILERGTARLTILGDPASISERAAELGVDLADATVIDHLTSPLAEEFAADFAELRKKKGVTLEQARETMKDISYFATMMVHKGLADGMVSGAAHTTAHTIKPSFQIIKTAPGASVVSSIFLMVMRGRLWAFGDCAVNPNPTAEQLGEIASVSAKTAAQFGIEPRVAMLSYSTGTSGSGPDVDKAVAAVAAAHELDPELKVDGPLQFDAACDPGVAAKKAPESEVAGKATVFVFPDLEAGNIAYKTAQRTAGALAVGPILQGLNKPINDLSRGATVPDIVNTVAITAIQAGA